ncbi:GNAT family N-acetyltransferase [Hamadaea tsunoensis]|uniref:GNAT family N-acetyltransferase n=1 Tax=Hamadaea tsunoensis TaxID=53368 RepID=UPI0003FBDB83|nr:GNAT family N-acetyltransferase [Hamadaea tsunoensis]
MSASSRTGETLYYLEVRSPEAVRASRRLPADVTIVEQTDPRVVRDTTVAIGAPWDWPTGHWTDPQWAEYATRADTRHWTLHRGGVLHGRTGTAIGLASLRFAVDEAGADEVELETFGLVPAHVGGGVGGPFLVEAARIAFREAPAATRLWLHTSSADHPYALENYLRRGFDLYQTMPTR